MNTISDGMLIINKQSQVIFFNKGLKKFLMVESDKSRNRKKVGFESRTKLKTE